MEKALAAAHQKDIEERRQAAILAEAESVVKEKDFAFEAVQERGRKKHEAKRAAILTEARAAARTNPNSKVAKKRQQNKVKASKRKGSCLKREDLEEYIPSSDDDSGKENIPSSEHATLRAPATASLRVFRGLPSSDNDSRKEELFDDPLNPHASDH